MASNPDRQRLKEWILQALLDSDGEAPLVGVAKHIWAKHEADLRKSGDFFYRWQYDMRWAATELRKEGRIELNAAGEKWRLVR